ncbi:cupin domain-containing protein [Sphingopyxis flava]|uniref:Cupin domain protein n=1 Tax=Sphingopyxis flava TaxID=1507287 RepID=A0A1T5GQ25_9SPHN|nr:hypothetical protein [Sphingopyxis flava]SKC10440.1 Cupin domain protein [Sphingopyxis flava]
MAKVHVHSVDELIWKTVREQTRDNPLKHLSEANLNAQVLIHEAGSETSCQLFETIFEAGAEVAIHRHDEDEIMYVVDGEMMLGARKLSPGSSVFIAGGTFYGFKAGPNGLRFLNFRPRADNSYIPAPQQPARA